MRERREMGEPWRFVFMRRSRLREVLIIPWPV